MIIFNESLKKELIHYNWNLIYTLYIFVLQVRPKQNERHYSTRSADPTKY